MSENKKVLNEEELVKVAGGKMGVTGGGEGNAAKTAAMKSSAYKTSAANANAAKSLAAKVISAVKVVLSRRLD